MGDRLIGLDIARYFAFVGMVIVNFDAIKKNLDFI